MARRCRYGHFEATRDDYDVEDEESYSDSEEEANAGVSGRTWCKRLVVVEASASRSFALSVVVVASLVECDVGYVALESSGSHRSASLGGRHAGQRAGAANDAVVVQLRLYARLHVAPERRRQGVH